MNDLEMYREQLALCDDKIIDALMEHNVIAEKIMVYKEKYGMPILQPLQEEKQERKLKEKLEGRRKFMMYSSGLGMLASRFRQGSCFLIILF